LEGNLYIDVGSISGEVRDIGRAASWTEDRAKEGKCRGASVIKSKCDDDDFVGPCQSNEEK
jgi:hypothetical protein